MLALHVENEILHRIWVRFSQTRMGRSLSSNQDVSRVRRRLAGEARPRAVCGTLPLHPAEIIDLGGDLLFSRQLPAPWSEPGLLTRVRTSSPSTGRAVLERRPAVAARISPFSAPGPTATVRRTSVLPPAARRPTVTTTVRPTCTAPPSRDATKITPSGSSQTGCVAV